VQVEGAAVVQKVLQELHVLAVMPEHDLQNIEQKFEGGAGATTSDSAAKNRIIIANFIRGLLLSIDQL
jgi:hypothetical protein